MALALHHYGSLEALERDYFCLVTPEQWDFLFSLPDKAEIVEREAQGVNLLAATEHVQARHRAELMGTRRDGSATEPASRELNPLNRRSAFQILPPEERGYFLGRR